MAKKTVNKLRKALGVAFGIAIIVGGTIGVGILRTPGNIAMLLHNELLILSCWIFIGLLIMLSASSYAELTAMMPKAGGAYNYIKRAFGNYPGFITGWFDFICNAIAPAYFCIVLAEYSSILLPVFKDHQTLVALFYLTAFMLLNIPGIKTGSITQQITSAAKMVLFLALIVACFIKGPVTVNGLSSIDTGLMKGGIIIAIFKALQLILGAYDGWMAVSFFAEEDSNPGKNIPKSYFLGALSVSLIYILVNAAVLYVLPVKSIASSQLAASDAAAIAFGNKGALFMTIISVFSLLSILNAYMMIPPRILYGLSRDGFFVKQGLFVNEGGTPVFNMAFCYVLAFVLVLSSSFEQLFSLGAFMMTIVTISAFASLIKLRISEPNIPRPYKTWGYPYSTILAITVSVLLFFGFAYSDTKNLLIILIISALSFPCYKWLTRKTK
jgi:APA family basic amino acid/polyamine antiporter